MRMWMVDPKILCRKHLLGEHGELHKHRHTFVKKYSIAGRISPVVQIEPLQMKNRHDKLAEEIKRRNFNHNSPYTMPDLDYLSVEHRNAVVDLTESVTELCKRCPACKQRIQKIQKISNNFIFLQKTG